MHKLNYLRIAIIVFMLLSAASPAKPLAFANPGPVDLLTVENFLGLAASAVSSPIGGTILNGGDLGITGAGCTNFPAPCSTPGVGGVVIAGVIHDQDGVATQGQTDATAVVADLNLRAPDMTIAGGLLDGLILDQGVYDVPAAVTNLTGTLTLNGDENSIFIFRFASTFVTAGTARVDFTGGAQACNVYWTAGAGVTFNGATRMVGTVFAQSSVSFPGGGATVNGRVIAQTGAITFNNTVIDNTPCVFAIGGSGGGGGGGGGGGVGGLPDTGGAPIRNEDLPWSLMVAGSFSALALVLGIREYRRTHLPKQ